MKKTRLKPISKKQAERQREFNKLKPALLERCQGKCERCGEWHGRFGNFALHPHHKILKSHCGGDSEDNIEVLCWRCHIPEGHWKGDK